MDDQNLGEKLTENYSSFSAFALLFLHGKKAEEHSYTKSTKYATSSIHDEVKFTNVHMKSKVLEHSKEQHDIKCPINLSVVPDPYFRHLMWTRINGLHLNLSALVMYPNLSHRKIICDEMERQITYLTKPHTTKIKIHGELHSIPRRQAAYGNTHCLGKPLTYTYSGIKLIPRPWTEAPILDEIRLHLNDITGIEYNFVLVNRYQDGRDKMGDHKDDEKAGN